METNANIKQKRCVYCGRFFKPDRRVRARQKSCKERECQKRRKGENQKMWVEANPGYFQGRYAYVREWRAKRCEIQDEIVFYKDPG